MGLIDILLTFHKVTNGIVKLRLGILPQIPCAGPTRAEQPGHLRRQTDLFVVCSILLVCLGWCTIKTAEET